jgi:hypothetical protein
MVNPEKEVLEPEDFFGQKGIIRRIFSRIGAERPQSVAVIGSRKIGKTSLINVLNHESMRNKYLENPEAFRIIRIALGEEKIDSVEDFLKHLLPRIMKDSSSDALDYNDLKHAVELLHRKHYRLILLLDDFHHITTNRNFPLEFFSFLRSLANNYNLAYVTTSVLELQKLCAVKDVEESPFFNIFTNITLGHLSAEEGRLLLETVGNLPGKTAEALVNWCGPSPYLLKTAMREIDSGTLNAEAPSREIEKCLFPLFSEYYSKVVSVLGMESFRLLKIIGKGKSPDHRDLHYIRPLIKQGFLIDDEEIISCYSPAFIIFLKKQLSREMLKGKDNGNAGY